MLWPTNNQKLAAATMFTLFFAGNDFAPQTRVNGVPIQEYLQAHFINAFRQVARRLKDLPEVRRLRHPQRTRHRLHRQGRSERRPGTASRWAKSPPLSNPCCWAMASRRWWMSGSSARRGAKKIGNPCSTPAGSAPGCRITLASGASTASGSRARTAPPRLLRPDYFSQVGGRPVNFNQDYVKPFINRFARAIRSEHPQALIFVETNRRQPLPAWGPADADNIVSAPHWYDGTVLFTKQFNRLGRQRPAWRQPHLRPRQIRRAYAAQVRAFQQSALQGLRGAPTLIGETGIPFDLDDRKAFEQGDFSAATRAMDRSLHAMDDALASYTLWTYTPDNTNLHGDLWNDEDLSIFSRDQQSDPADIKLGRARPAGRRAPLRPRHRRAAAAHGFRLPHPQIPLRVPL